MPFLFGNFQVFLKNVVKNVQFRYGMTGKFFFRAQTLSPPPPPRKHFREKFLGALFNVLKCPWKPVPP
jgi:hypothetical protein